MGHTIFDAGGLYPIEFHSKPKRISLFRSLLGLDPYPEGSFRRKCAHCEHEFEDRSPYIFLCKTCKRYFQTGFCGKHAHGRLRGKGRDSWEFERKRFVRSLTESLRIVGLP